MYMKSRFLIVLLFTLAVCITSVLAQGIHLLPRASQLPGPVIRRIVQDPEGYMWYGTTDWGLCRDNGYQIDHINTPGEVSTEGNGYVNDLCATADGHVAWSTRAGAWLLDKRNYGVKPFNIYLKAGAGFGTKGFSFNLTAAYGLLNLAPDSSSPLHRWTVGMDFHLNL